MRKKKSLAVCFATAACCVFMAGYVSAREVVDCNFGWKSQRTDGDMMTDKLYVANGWSLHRGTALPILRAGRETGRVTFTAEAEGFEPVALTFEVK